MLQINTDEDKIDGSALIAQTLVAQGVKVIYGVVGIPVVEIAILAQQHGIEFYGFRNEQAASYAAGAYGYMNQEPGICLAVPGPGMVHAMAGVANAWSNCWPMVLIAGHSESSFDSMGSFQESPQLEVVKTYCKYACRPDSIERLPFFIERAIRISKAGRPGPCYIELPAQLITGTIPKTMMPTLPPIAQIPRSQADPAAINAAIKLLQSAKRPLVIIGKGMAYARAEQEVNELVDTYKLPFLATPMGKGVVDDNHSLSVAAARSTALQNADVVLLLGARLNWILHFGRPPRYSKDVKFIQLDIDPATPSDNALTPTIGLVGDGQLVTRQLLQALKQQNVKLNIPQQWTQQLQSKIQKNTESNNKMMNDNAIPMSYYRAYKDIREFVTKDTIVVSEGANTMDIGRGLMLNALPRHRLDAGTYATMGVSFGFAIAAAADIRQNKLKKRVLVVDGDSGFGFSAMELETAVRYRLPITFVVINNSGVYSGVDPDDSEIQQPGIEINPTQLGTKVRYDNMCIALGGLGYYVEDPAQLKFTIARALQEVEAKQVPGVINVIIQTSGQRREQEHSWLTKPASKL